MSAPQSTRDKMTGALYWTFVPRLVQMFITIGTSVWVVKALGEFEFGRLQILQPILALLVIVLSAGLGQALNRFVPELRVKGPVDQARALLYRCLGLQSLLWVLAVGAVLLFRDALRAYQIEYANLFILGVTLAIAEIWAQSMNSYAIASYRTREVAIGLSLGTVVYAIGTAVLLSRGLKVDGVLWSLAIGHLTNAIFLGVLLYRVRTPGVSLAVSRSEFPTGRLLRYALPWVPNSALHFVVWRSSEQIILGKFHPAEFAGYFNRAYSLPQMALEFVPNAIYPLVLASFSESRTVTRDAMPRFIDYYYRLLFFVSVPIALGGFVFGDFMIEVLYPELTPAQPYCQAFFLIFMVTFFGTPLSMAVYVVEKVWVNLLLNVGYGIVTVGLDFLLIPKYGLLGATIPTAIVTILTPYVRWLIAKRYVEGIRIPWAFIGRIYLAATPLLALFWVKPWFRGAGGLLAAALVGGVATLVLYRIFRVLGPDDREFIANSKLPGKEWILRLL
ncbi:MAG: oligosaccharide flippase family protein [Candidatus Eisenbacteria bacterium]